METPLFLPEPKQEQLSFLTKDKEDKDRIFSVLDLVNKLRAHGIIEVGTTELGLTFYKILLPLNEPLSHERKELKRRIGSIFRRKQTTQWSRGELVALRNVTILPDELSLVEEYYKSEARKPTGYCRTSVLTFLRHFPGEVDRAKRWKEAKINNRCY